MSGDRCVKCGRKLKKLMQYDKDLGKLIENEKFVQCDRCDILFRKSEGYKGVN